MAWLSEEFINEERHAELAYLLSLSDDVKRMAALQAEIDALWAAEWGEAAGMGPRAIGGAAYLAENMRGSRTCEDYLASVTTGTAKKAWVIDRPMKLAGVRLNTRASDRTTGSDVADVNKNNVTMFTTKPTQAAATIGDWTVVPPDASGTAAEVLTVFKAGDELSWDVDTASTGGTGKTVVSVAILLRHI